VEAHHQGDEQTPLTQPLEPPAEHDERRRDAEGDEVGEPSAASKNSPRQIASEAL
jgi:hypothetical protein